MPAELFINIDQLTSPFVLISKYRLEESQVHPKLPSTADYRKIMFGITLSSDFIHIHINISLFF